MSPPGSGSSYQACTLMWALLGTQQAAQVGSAHAGNRFTLGGIKQDYKIGS